MVAVHAVRLRVPNPPAPLRERRAGAGVVEEARMHCKQCGAKVVRGWLKRGRTRVCRVRLCTRCGRADYLDEFGYLRVVWRGKWRLAV